MTQKKNQLDLTTQVEDEQPGDLPALMNQDGTINPAAFTRPDKRIEAFRKMFPTDTYNVVLFSQFILSKLPEGVKLYPQLVEIRNEDLWTSQNAAEVGLKPGQAMINSRAVEKIAQAAGVKLEKVRDEEIKIGGELHLLIEYIASVRLPDGTIEQTPPTGKSLPIKTKSGNNQAHIRESVDMKARRNACKALLAIPTTLPIEHATRYWVTAKAVYDDTPAGQALREKTIQASQTATAKLYDEPPQIQDAKVEDEGPSLFEQKTIAIENAGSLEELKRIAETIDKSQYTKTEFMALKGYYSEAHNRLKGDY